MNGTLKASVKLMLKLLFVTFADFMLTISFAVLLSKSPKWVFYAFLQVFAITILIVVIWQDAYMLGFRDSNMVKTGHKKEDLFRGVKIGLIAQIPWTIFLVLSLIFNFRFAVYRLLNSAYYWFLTAIAGNSQYMRMGAVKIGAFALLLLIVPLLSGGIYVLGYRGIDLFTKIVYKNRKE